MKRIYIIAACIAAAFLPACENDEFTWGDYAYARLFGPAIWTLGTDSLLYTFSIRPAETVEFTVAAEVIVMGKATDRDRTVRLAVDPTRTTATKGLHYALPETVTVPAGETRAACPITLYRSPDLQSAAVRLCVAIVDGGDLPPGVSEWNSLAIRWSDMISRPLNWDALTEFFGEYSEIKYRFIISTLGVAEFTYGDTDGMSWGAMNNYRLMLADALARYNAEHPSTPLTDENNQLVTF
ncbi:MAG: DUF4843 domain-containing protein [Odoribacteraceae bacterium]|jgi:hypothetical protein|nr:DUF4843 domain-containing protein [Odoribacteraceae bacterium]